MNENLLNKIGKETVYMGNTMEEAVLKSEPQGPYFAKFPGGKEFKVEPKTDIVAGALLEGREITRSEYDSF